MCCTACHVDVSRRRRCSTYLSDHPGTNTRPCLVDSSEMNRILIGVKQKKIIIINNKKIHVFHNSCVMRGGPMLRRETTTKISSSCALSLSSPLLSRLHVWRSETVRICIILYIHMGVCHRSTRHLCVS
jgi:hypothetical protein